MKFRTASVIWVPVIKCGILCSFVFFPPLFNAYISNPDEGFTPTESYKLYLYIVSLFWFSTCGLKHARHLVVASFHSVAGDEPCYLSSSKYARADWGQLWWSQNSDWMMKIKQILISVISNTSVCLEPYVTAATTFTSFTVLCLASCN